MTIEASTALITGGSSGIGRAAANKLAQLGIHVVVAGRNMERGEKTSAQQEARRTIFRPTSGMRRARAR